MFGNLAMAIEVQPRHPGGRKIKQKPRAPRSLWIRHRSNLEAMQERPPEEFREYLRIGRPEFGTVIGELYGRGVFDETDCAAARLVAEIVGRHDRYHQVKDPKVQGSPRSPSYERGFGGGDDEIERRTQDGTIVAYERKARRAQKADKKLQALIVNDRARTVLYNVCIYNLHPSAEQIPDLKAQLRIIWDKFKHRYQRQDHGKIRSHTSDTRDHPFNAAAEEGVVGAVAGEEPAAEPAAEPVAG